MPYTRRVSRPHRLATVALLAVLLWTPAHAAVCLGWCDLAPAEHHALAHADPDADPVAGTTAPCHGAAAVIGTTLSPVAPAACDDVRGAMESGVLPASMRAALVAAPAAFVCLVTAPPRSFAWRASDAGPPGLVSSRAPLVLRI